MPSQNSEDVDDRLTGPEELLATFAGTRGEECTLYPEDAAASRPLTEWITAESGSFVTVSQMR
ncbi:MULTISPECIES: DUF7511 domain-containing protein [Halorussus]|uniref:DUF7511 domain-containing protein n=1 Tax=Halorussus TaxID=1070314 RepID=UPI0020A1D68E|nr:hypothetical protein [Halorussus vallis]USZ77941.1 hypothetical protein NGM07_22455 [Halorussus vallis]